MALCALCNEYPEGSACTASGCPGRPFRLGRTTGARAGDLPGLPAQPPCIADEGGEVDLAAWLCTVPGIPADWPSSQPIGDRLALADLAGRA